MGGFIYFCRNNFSKTNGEFKSNQEKAYKDGWTRTIGIAVVGLRGWDYSEMKMREGSAVWRILENAFSAIILIQYNSEFIHLLFLLFPQKSLSRRVSSAKRRGPAKKAVRSVHSASYIELAALVEWINEEAGVSLTEDDREGSGLLFHHERAESSPFWMVLLFENK